MALSVLRLGSRAITPKLVSPMVILRPQVATIVSKQLRDRDYARPKPFDYKNKSFNRFYLMFDKTSPRLDENSKIITVDGAIASGKTKLAKELAEQLDMHYISAPDFDQLYINDYGFDMRRMNYLLPEKTRCHDIKDFLKEPKHLLTTKCQYDMFYMKLEKYVDALKHVLNTGQGVVLDTSVYSDIVFLETLVKFGFISAKAYKWLWDSRDMTVPQLMRPHVSIYLDTPVSEVLKNIKARNLPEESNSPFYTPEILAYLEQTYKQNYLKEINKHAEILVYDWTEESESEVVVEDLEQLDFLNYERNSTKMKDWAKEHEDEWRKSRFLYTNFQHYFKAWSIVPRFDVPEIFWEGEERQQYERFWYSAPGMKYATGYNKNMGDDGILFKNI